MKANYTINQELNGIEISFDEKPEAATLDSLKTAGYRWHRVKKVWYAKQTNERLTLAKSFAEEGTAEAAATTPAADPEKINLDNLGENKPHLYGTDLAKAIREDLKKRNVKGVSVRARRVTHETGITVTIKATAADFASLEEMKLRKTYTDFCCQVEAHGAYTGEKWLYSFGEMTEAEKEAAYNAFIEYNARKSKDINTHWLIDCRKDYYTFTTAFFNKVVSVFKIANQWNYNNSDPMSDYFDIGYFLDIDVKMPEGYEPREAMTEEERAAYNAEIEAEERAREEAYKKYEEERKQAAEEAARRKAWTDAATAEILADITIKDLEEKEKLYITNLSGGIGKEATLQEVRETIAEYSERAAQDAEITRIITFKSRAALEKYEQLLLYDFDFCSGKGGTGCEDIRLKDYNMYCNMTPEQREQLKTYNADSIAVYFDNELQFVINPEGYTYARYVYIPGEDTEILNAAGELEAQKKESEKKPDFHMPQPVKDQAAQLHEGQKVTIYQCDGWMLNSIYAGAGTVTGFYIGKYAQYDNVLYIELLSGGRSKTVCIRNKKDCLIYEGIKKPLPDEVTRRKISDTMSELYNADKLIPNTYNYYLQQGEKPIIDTCYR